MQRYVWRMIDRRTSYNAVATFLASSDHQQGKVGLDNRFSLQWFASKAYVCPRKKPRPAHLNAGCDAKSGCGGQLMSIKRSDFNDACVYSESIAAQFMSSLLKWICLFNLLKNSRSTHRTLSVMMCSATILKITSPDWLAKEVASLMRDRLLLTFWTSYAQIKVQLRKVFAIGILIRLRSRIPLKLCDNVPRAKTASKRSFETRSKRSAMPIRVRRIS